jgi:hypothetical protein
MALLFLCDGLTGRSSNSNAAASAAACYLIERFKKMDIRRICGNVDI